MNGTVRSTPERRLLAAGLALAVGALAMLWMAFLINPAWGFGLGAAMLAELVTGREAAIPLAVAQGVPPGVIAVTSILQNLAVAAIVVPLVLRLTETASHGRGWSGRQLRRLQMTAAAHQGRGRGAWAVFLFMLIPFLANGPVIAGLVGRLAGIHWSRLVAAVVTGVIVTATAWSFGYAALARALGAVDPRLAALPGWIATGFVVYAIGRLILEARKDDPEIAGGDQ